MCHQVSTCSNLWLNNSSNRSQECQSVSLCLWQSALQLTQRISEQNSIIHCRAHSEPSSGTLRPRRPFTPCLKYFIFVGKFVDRSLPPTPPPEKVNPQSHSIWDSDTAKVSLLPATSNNNDKNSLSSLSLKEDLQNNPWYKSCDRKKAEQMLLKCKYSS